MTTGASARTAPQSQPELSSDDWKSLREAYDAARHSAWQCNHGVAARNPGQCWQTLFDTRAFIITPDAGDWTWGLSLLSYGRVGAEHVVTAPECVEHDGARVSYEWDACLTEWYLNDRRGLEHGYTLHHRPSGADEPTQFTLSILGGLQPRVSRDGRSVAFADAHDHTVINYSGLTVFDADGVTVPAHFVPAASSASTGLTLQLVVDDRGARYPLTIDPVAQQAYLKSSNSQFGDAFGFSLAASGDTLVVGAYSEDSAATGVNGDQSNQSGGTSGAAYVFVRSGGVWSQQAYLKASNTGVGDRFGYAVDIDGDTIVVGAWGEDSNGTGVNGDQTDNTFTDNGAAYVFTRSGTTWSQQAYLKSPAGGFEDLFGKAVAVSGDTVVVGAHQEDSNASGVNGNPANNSSFNAGAAYVFARNGSTWSQQAYLKHPIAGAVNAQFGLAVAASGDTVVVGARLSGDGGCFVFVRNGSTWSQQTQLVPSNAGTGDQVGTAVDIDGDSIVVGAFSEDSSATGVNGNQADNGALHSGAAYVFTRSGTVWSQEAYLKASNTDAQDNFGVSVDISGDRVVVGAALEWSNATGVDGNQSDNSLHWAGAAYLFERSLGNWSQIAYLKASNTEENDQFGWDVAIAGNAGDMVVVGAPNEDSQAVGIDGFQGNDEFLGSNSGAAYAYDSSSALPCPGDLGGDGVTDGADLALVLGSWGNTGAPGIPGDANLDGTVDGADLAIVLGSWGPCP